KGFVNKKNSKITVIIRKEATIYFFNLGIISSAPIYSDIKSTRGAHIVLMIPIHPPGLGKLLFVKRIERKSRVIPTHPK
ncbi:unnamed protein product, partial [marine sediment metagenome]